MAIRHDLGLPGPAQFLKAGLFLPDSSSSSVHYCQFGGLAEGDDGHFRLDGSRYLSKVPTAHLVDIPVGAGIVHGDLVSIGNLEIREVCISIRKEHSGLRQRGDLDCLLGQIHRQEDFEFGEQHRWFYEPVVVAGTPGRLIATCDAIFKAYYATSSPLAEMIYFGRLEESIRRLIKSGRSSFNSEKALARLYLDNNFRRPDALVLARAIFDPTDYAREQTLAVSTYLQLGMRRQEPRSIRAMPPFVGESTWKVVGRAVGPTKQDFLVVQILRCSHQFPFEKLHVEIEQSQRKVDSGKGEGTQGHARPIPPWQHDLIVIEGHGARPTTRIPRLTQIASPHTHYSALKREDLKFIPRPIANGSTGGSFPVVDPSTRHSSKKASGSGSSDSRETSTSSKVQEHTVESASESGSVYPSQAFQSCTEGIDHACRILGCQANSVIVATEAFRYGNWGMNAIPAEGKMRHRSWLLIEGGAMRRCVLIVEMELSNHYLYVVEVLRNIGDAMATLVLGRNGGARIEQANLSEIFDRIDNAQKLPTNAVLLSGIDNGFVVRLKHCPPTGKPNRLTQTIVNFLGGRDHLNAAPVETATLQ